MVLRRPKSRPDLRRTKSTTHLNSDTSQTSSRETTPSGSEASGELENENEDDFRGQQYDPIGPVDETTESRRLRSLAASGVQTEERSMPTTHLQPLQGNQPAHHPLSNQPLSNSTSTALSSATQNPQLADYLTLVVTGAGGRPKLKIWQHMQIDKGPEDEGCSVSHCEDPHRTGLLVKCTGVGCGLQVSMLV